MEIMVLLFIKLMFVHVNAAHLNFTASATTFLMVRVSFTPYIVYNACSRQS